MNDHEHDPIFAIDNHLGNLYAEMSDRALIGMVRAEDYGATALETTLAGRLEEALQKIREAGL